MYKTIFIYNMKTERIVIMLMYKTIFIYNMKACTTNYYVYVQMANMYYEDCTSNHYVYVQANMYYGRLYI